MQSSKTEKIISLVLASLDCLAEEMGIVAIIIPELKFGHVERTCIWR